MELTLRLAFMMVATPTACAVALWRPFWGLLCLVFMYYFRPEIWNAPDWFRPIMWITAFVALGWATRVRTFRWHALMSASLMVLIGMILASMFAQENKPAAFDCTLIVGKLMVVEFLALQLIDSFKKLTQFIWMNVVGMAWNIKTVLYLGFTGQGVTEDLRVDVGVGQGGGANYIAMIFVMFLPILIMKFQNGSRREKRAALGLMPLVVLCIIFTGSRSAFLGSAAVLLHQLFRSNRKALALAAIVLIAGVTYFAMPDYHIERLQKGIGTGDDERRDFAAESRLLLWKAGLEMFRDSPVVGVGPDNFQILSPEYAGFYAGRSADKYIPGVRRPGMVTHNTWIQTLAEGGIVTAIPFASMFVLGFVFLVRARRRIPRTWPEWKDVYTLSVILEGMFLGFCVCAFFGSYIKIDFLWWYLGAIGALSLAVEDRLAHFHEARKRSLIASNLRRGPPGSFPAPSPSGA